MRFRTSLAAVVVLASATSWTSVALADESATVKLGGGWIALGVGANWGDGILTFAGYQYPFSIRGLSLGDFGAAGFTAFGKARGLDRAEREPHIHADSSLNLILI